MFDLYDNKSEYFLSMINIIDGISKDFQNDAISNIDEYLRILDELKWPLYLIPDMELKKKLLIAYNSKMQSHQINEIIFNHFSNDVLENIEYSWDCCKLISFPRKVILSEAIRAHKEQRYYLSTPVLMCHIYGISEDIVNYVKQVDLCLGKLEKDKLMDYLKTEKRYINNEKGKLFQSFAITDSNGSLWLSILNYFKNIVLASGAGCDFLSQTQPLRNKICHGQQLNYGTQEHSLKSILVIDILIKLAEELDWIVTLRDIMKEVEDGGVLDL